MRLLLILPRIPFPEHDGAALVMARTLRTLNEAGHDVFVFSLNPSRQRSQSTRLAEVCTDHTTVDVDTEVSLSGAVCSMVAPRDVSAFGLDVHASYWVERFLNVDALKALYEFQERIGDVDAVICETLFCAAYGAALRSERSSSSTRYILRAHNVEHRIQQQLAERASTAVHRWYRQYLARTTRDYEQAVAARFDVIATLSEHDAAWFNNVVKGAHIHVVPAGVDVHPLPHSMPADRLCFLGSLDWVPNQEGLLWFVQNVLPLINERLTTVRLVIGGRSASALPTDVLHHGRCDVVGEVDDAIAFRQENGPSIVPLLSGSGVRIKILEAMGAGCPVVTTALGNEGLPFQHGNHLRIADDAESFARECVDVLLDPSRSLAEAAAGRDLVAEKMTWGASIDTLLATVTT